jgi:hypothetical protein
MPDDRKNIQTFYSFQTQSTTPSKLLNCMECITLQDCYVLVTDTREIICSKCMKEKMNKK